jgi:alpha-tubulin suppressor-like RCC1 family protein
MEMIDQSYIPPVDQKKMIEIKLSDEIWKSLANVSNLVSFDHFINEEILKNHQLLPLINFDKKTRFILRFPSLEVQSKSANLKSLPAAAQVLSSFFVTIHDIDGYDFTNEFIQVYNGKIDVGSVDDDTLTILRRAIKCAVPSIDDKYLIKLSNTIMSSSTTELFGLDRRVKESLKHFFPKMPQLHSRLNIALYNAKLVVGRHINQAAETIRIWLRVTIPINLIIPSENNSSASQQSSYEVLLNTCYQYHTIETASIDGDASWTYTKTCDHNELYLLVKPRLLSTAVNNSSSPDRATSHLDSPPRTPSSTGSKSSHASANTRSIKHLANKLDKLPNVDVMVWGMNEDYSLGCLDEGVIAPRSVPFPIPAYLDPIKQIACGPRHSLILTSTGLIYSSGNNSEGALGSGDLLSRAAFTPVNWHRLNQDDTAADKSSLSTTASKTPYIVKIAAGGGLIGSHSMAVDRDGAVYGWGEGHAAGALNLKPVLQPARISFDEALNAARNRPITSKTGVISTRIVDISCGNCFTIALSSHGQVYSWGMLSHGRLGIGSVANLRDNSSRRAGQQPVRYKLQPSLITSISHAVKIACGDAHAMCVVKSGELYCWGKNSHGQLGTGPTAQGLLKDSFSPTRIRFGSQDEESTNKNLKVTNICAGTFHSLAVDEDDGIWSWGGRGNACLGQGVSSSSNLQSSWSSRSNMNNAFMSSTSLPPITVPYELLPWCKLWSTPQKIESFDSQDVAVPVIGLAAGNEYSAFHFRDGSLFLAGSGPVMPKPAASQQKSAVVYSLPTRPPSIWTSGLSSRKCLMVQGNAAKIFVLFDGESISQSLTSPLYRRIRTGQSLDDYIDNSSIFDNDILSVDKQSITDEIFNQPDGYSLLQSYGLADCLIIAAGRVLAAHRAILAARSPVLRDMILSELPLDDEDGSANDVIQLLLPELRADTASSFLYYLYTDSIPSTMIRNSVVIKSLLDMGKLFKIPRLQVLCKCLVAANTALELSRLGVTADDDSMADFHFERPPTTLSKDLSALVGDPQFADVRFLVDGKTLYAHRFILEHRSEYFKAMFRSGMSESETRSSYREESTRKRMIDVMVPDSYFALFRMLLFMYTDTFSEAPIDVLLEDLIMADRYGVSNMKRHCESMIIPSHESWIDILTIAEMINSKHMTLAVKSFLVENMSTIKSLLSKPNDDNDDKYQLLIGELKERYPTLFDEIFQTNDSAHGSSPSEILIERVSAAATIRDRKQSAPNIPIWVLLLLAVAVIGYQYVSTIIVLGWIIPFVNVIFTIIVIAWIIYRIGS